MLVGYAGFYLKGMIVGGEVFSYKQLERNSQSYNGVKGVEGVNEMLTIEVMGSVNPFKRTQMIVLNNGKTYSVMEMTEKLFSQVRDDLIITLTVGRN